MKRYIKCIYFILAFSVLFLFGSCEKNPTEEISFERQWAAYLEYDMVQISDFSSEGRLVFADGNIQSPVFYESSTVPVSITYYGGKESGYFQYYDDEGHKYRFEFNGLIADTVYIDGIKHVASDYIITRKYTINH